MTTSTEVELFHAGKLAMDTDCPVDHQHPASAQQWVLSFPASPTHSLPSLLLTYTVLILKLNQITHVNYNRNGLLHIGSDIAI